MNAGPGRRRLGLGYWRRCAADWPAGYPAAAGPASRAAAMTSARTPTMSAALTVTLGPAAACWVFAVWQMNGMDMGVATRLGSFGFFMAVWVVMMAAMTLPGPRAPG
ncbi:MAG TPA: hypothetical protein VIV12_18370, partial [Streptosporangiaceae bacterium]